MNQITTTGIVLSRTNYGEADRIITVLTPDQGKLRLVARGVRKIKSKMAGGLELFSVSDITYIRGRNDLGTLISSRLKQHYERIVQDIDRVQTGYDLIKTLNKVTEDETEVEYFNLLQNAFKVLDDSRIDLLLVSSWFNAQLLSIAGYPPNLQTDAKGARLQEGKNYSFDFDSMSLRLNAAGKITDRHIKLLRLLFSQTPPTKLGLIQDVNSLNSICGPIVKSLAQSQLHI